MANNVVPLTQSNSGKVTALQSQAHSLSVWIQTWWPEFDRERFQIVPPKVIPDLPRAMTAARKLCPPASIECFAVQMDRLITFARTFNLPNLDAKTATATYHETLRDLPDDLLEKAISETIRDHKSRFALPLPAEIRAKVGDLFQSRRKPLMKLEMAQRALDKSLTTNS